MAIFHILHTYSTIPILIPLKLYIIVGIDIMKLPFEFLLFICWLRVTGLWQFEFREIIHAFLSNFYSTGVSCALGAAVYWYGHSIRPSITIALLYYVEIDSKMILKCLYLGDTHFYKWQFENWQTSLDDDMQPLIIIIKIEDNTLYLIRYCWGKFSTELNELMNDNTFLYNCIPWAKFL